MLRPPPALADTTILRRKAEAGRGDRSGCWCSAHCSNSCEAQHCPDGTPLCKCWCHRVALRREVRRLKELRDEEKAKYLVGIGGCL